MCGRFALTRSPEELTRVFGLAECPDLAPRANIAPASDIAVVGRSPVGDPVLHLLRWGLVPHWRQDPTDGPRPINARSETVLTKPAFREAFRQRRCLIPADGFYEWQAQRGTKQPFFFSDPGGEVLALGGLWEWWRVPDGGLLRTCCILTTAANARVAPVHERMPLILAPRSWATWLGGPVAAAQALLVPAPAAALRCWPVSHRVNRVAEAGADLMAPVVAG
ncbi:MAG: SOS response-associated peptidase [Chromatiaceae bacterium]|nr:SOS response-associated peptidase [Chromatiaceae bacterium]